MTVASDETQVQGAEGEEASTRSAYQWLPGRFALLDTWIPIAHLPQVSIRPVRYQLHGQGVFIWRDGETIRAGEALPHGIQPRTATQATGGTGTFPVVERYGYAWIWYGDPSNMSLNLMPDVPLLRPEGKLNRNMWGTVVFDCTYELVCENLLDSTHADYVHSDLFGDPLSDEDVINVESTSETVTVIREAKNRHTPKAQRSIAKSDFQDARLVIIAHLRSGVTVQHGDYVPGLSIPSIQPNTPESPNRTRVSYTFNPKRGNALVRQMMPLVAHHVAKQDNRVLAPQNERYRKTAERADFSSRFDGAALQFRKRMKDLVERQEKGDFSYLSDADPGADVSKVLGLERES